MGLAWSERAHELNNTGRMWLLVASIKIDADLVGHVDELDLEQAGETRGVLALPRAGRRDERLLHRMQLEREYVALLVEELRRTQQWVLHEARQCARLLHQ